VELITETVHIVHGPKHVLEVFQNPNLCVTRAYGYALHHCFGMKKSSAAAYHADTSGSRARPIAGSRLRHTGRIEYNTHETLTEGHLGTGLKPATVCFEATLSESLQLCDIGQEWSHYDDLAKFFEDFLGRAVLQALFGPLLLETNKNFARDFLHTTK
jgi:hypothetical protein